jgi:predicted amidophosphoribosyltransferase
VAGDFDSSNPSRFLRKTLSVLSRGLGTAECRHRAGGGGRFLLESALEFLVEDACVLCGRPHTTGVLPREDPAGPAGRLLEPVPVRILFGALVLRNRPFCVSCATRLVAARSAGVLGRRVGRCRIETEIGGTFGSPERTGDEIPAGAEGGEDAEVARGAGPDGSGVRILSPFMTTNHVLEIVHLFKFRGYVGLGGPMGRAMAWAVEAFGGGVDGTAFFVPVAMDAKSLRQRGFNPAARLAATLSVDFGIPSVEIVRKTLRTRPQSKTPREKRASNVRRAFDCVADAAVSPAGRPVYLVDDLVTTGATSAACAAALLRAGASAVTVVCFGRAM